LTFDLDDAHPDLLRSIIAVLAGVAVVSLLVEPLELTLVRAVAGGPIASEAEYFAVRNRPMILAVRVVLTAMAGLLGGYVAAKIAGAREMAHVKVAAALQTAALVNGMVFGAYAAATPRWAWLAMIAVTAPAMLGGGWIRVAAKRGG
jgi:hypothetical protein